MQNSEHVNLLSHSMIDENLKQARELVAHLECGDITQADIVINELCKARENEMYNELGKLTRELHDTISDLGRDTKLNDIMQNEMPDARHNLNHVIDLTEDATNTTLTAVEECMPVLGELDKRTVSLKNILGEHIKKLVADSKLTFIEEEMDAYLDKIDVDIKHITKNINTVLEAQGFQDLSGQIIQRVSKMVHELEDNLVDILKINSSMIAEEKKEEVKNNAGYGPAVPGIDKGDVVTSQDDVDDLLSTLGF